MTENVRPHCPLDECGCFYPNNYVTFEEALSAFLKILGEKDFTPETIISLAEKYNLLKNVNVYEAEITRGNFTQLAYNFTKAYSTMKNR